ncbi:MAG: metal ABC transporter permease [Actinobacteria bacterium]|nr:MAG: metal ABC transporter permease [Actinomycetota bacterium]
MTAVAIASPFSFSFMVNALRAGTIVAVLAGALGWFMVLRRQTFVGHTLSLVGFPGAAGATLLGISPVVGYFAFCTGAAALVSALPTGGSARGFTEESAVVGSVQSLLLASGFLFVSLYAGNLGGLSSLLFGSFLGITARQVLALLAVALPAVVLLAALGRPLLFASVDPQVAGAAGVPVRAVSVAFPLLVLPPAAAQALTLRPAAGLLLSVGIGVGATWAGLLLAYYLPYPTGAFITTLSFAVYVIARIVRSIRHRRS